MTTANQTDPAKRNKQLLETAFAEAAKGNNRLFSALFADDIVYSKIGTTDWSKTYRGRPEVFGMFRRLLDVLDGPHITIAHRLIAEDNVVVVEASSRSRTKAGNPYENTYCLVYRLDDGMVKEVKEYCDTALIEAVL